VPPAHNTLLPAGTQASHPCVRSATSDTFDPFETLALPLDGDSVITCLTAFTSREKLTDAGKPVYKCAACRKVVYAEKGVHLAQLAEVMVLHLKRFSFRGMFSVKDSRPIRWRIAMDFAPFMALTAEQQTAAVAANSACLREGRVCIAYSVVGVVVHEGYTSDSGHYYAVTPQYMPRSSVRCFMMNDTWVREMASEDAMAEQPYLLFMTPWYPEVVEAVNRVARDAEAAAKQSAADAAKASAPGPAAAVTPPVHNPPAPPTLGTRPSSASSVTAATAIPPSPATATPMPAARTEREHAAPLVAGTQPSPSATSMVLAAAAAAAAPAPAHFSVRSQPLKLAPSGPPGDVTPDQTALIAPVGSKRRRSLTPPLQHTPSATGSGSPYAGTSTAHHDVGADSAVQAYDGVPRPHKLARVHLDDTVTVLADGAAALADGAASPSNDGAPADALPAGAFSVGHLAALLKERHAALLSVTTSPATTGPAETRQMGTPVPQRLPGVVASWSGLTVTSDIGAVSATQQLVDYASDSGSDAGITS